MTRTPQDSAGRPIAVGDRVSWRGQIYTIKSFGDLIGRYGTRAILFEESLHIHDEIPDEIAVDLVEVSPRKHVPVRSLGIPAYTQEQFKIDRTRLLAVIGDKHGVAESEVDTLIREHRYEHSSEDPEDRYIQIMAMARAAGWL